MYVANGRGSGWRKGQTRPMLDRILDRIFMAHPAACWEWTGSVAPHGYATIKRPGSRKTIGVHRAAYEAIVGPIPPGMTLDHLCKNKRCCNPAHLEVVTSRENTLRADTITAANAGKTHCPRGHEYTPENTYWQKRTTGRPFRRCRSCFNRKA